MNVSPCMRCTRVPSPGDCENKGCRQWQQWYITKWENMRFSVRADMEKIKRAPEGVCIGGSYYSQPHRVRSYLQKDPCDGCLCPRDICTLPCAMKRNWIKARQNVLLS